MYNSRTGSRTTCQFTSSQSTKYQFSNFSGPERSATRLIVGPLIGAPSRLSRPQRATQGPGGNEGRGPEGFGRRAGWTDTRGRHRVVRSYGSVENRSRRRPPHVRDGVSSAWSATGASRGQGVRRVTATRPLVDRLADVCKANINPLLRKKYVNFRNGCVGSLRLEEFGFYV